MNLIDIHFYNGRILTIADIERCRLDNVALSGICTMGGRCYGVLLTGIDWFEVREAKNQSILE
jgi:hypothetical protein